MRTDLPPLPSGVYLVYKPAGMTSRTAIERFGAQFGERRRVGHAGTLDPFATGLLIVGVGKGTRSLSQFFGLPKRYRAVVCLGRATTTDDPEGSVETTASAAHFTQRAIEVALAQQEGVLSLPVPRFSAVRIGGKRLYQLARSHCDVTPPIRRMEVRRAHFLSTERAHHEEAPHALHVQVEWEVGSGTYIRSLARDLGRRLGVPASLCALTRIAVGPYHLDDPRVCTIS